MAYSSIERETKMKKIKIAFIKFGGLACGGTEKVLQTVAVNLPPELFEVDYYYCDAAPYIGSDFKHLDTDSSRLEYMKNSNVRLIKFDVGFKDIRVPTHDWIDTNFWELFDEEKYDLIQTGRAGHPEYPFCHIHKTPIVDSIHLSGMAERKKNVHKTILVGQKQRETWINVGGESEKSVVIPPPVEIPEINKEDNFFSQFVKEGIINFGMHQRDDDGIYSPLLLEAYSKLENKSTMMYILGGSSLYRKQASDLNIKNIKFFNSTGDVKRIHEFLSCLNIYTHARKDGEQCSSAIIEAMNHGLPFVSHAAPSMGHVDQIKEAGLVVDTVEQYTAAMESMINDDKFYNNCCVKSQEQYDAEYSMKSVIARYIQIYEDVVFPEAFFNQISYFNHNKEYDKSSALEYEKNHYLEKKKKNFSNLYQDDHPQGRDLDRFTHLKEAVDVGSGCGWFSSYLIEKRKFKKVYAIEPSKAAIDISKKIVDSADKINWINGYAEEKIRRLDLKEPTFFNFMCILAHMPDDLAEEVCKAVDIVAPIGSVASFSEPWGEYHNDINDCWHIRPKQWWQDIFKNWSFEFYEDYSLGYGRYKGFTAVKEK